MPWRQSTAKERRTAKNLSEEQGERQESEEESAMAMARRAVPSISGIVSRLCGIGHCQRKSPQSQQQALQSQQEWHQWQESGADFWRMFLERGSGAEKELKIVLLGRPGSGKGTYGTRLSKLLKAPHISTGDLIREELRSNRFLSEIVNQGKLLPDEKVLELLSERLDQGESRGEKGFILDGFPRTVKQAEILEEVAEIDVAVNFKLDLEALLRKCLGRRICGDCGQIFSLVDVQTESGRMPAMPPPPECMSKMIHRKDDTQESIRRRLEVYDLESSPVEDFYRRRNKLVEFDVFGSVEENWPKLLEAMNLEDGQEGQSVPSKFWTRSDLAISACPKWSTGKTNTVEKQQVAAC